MTWLSSTNDERPPLPGQCCDSLQSPTKVSDIVDAYLRHSQAVGTHGESALAERLRTFKRFKATFGHLLISECKAFMLADWIESNPGWRSTATRKAKANQINAAFNWAVDEDRILRNPFR